MLPQERKAPNRLGILSKDAHNLEFIHKQLNTMRVGGKDILFSSALERGVLKAANGAKIVLAAGEGDGGLNVFDQFLQDVGIDKYQDTTSFVLALPEDQHWIVPEFFLEAIEQGMRSQNEFYQALIANVVTQETLEFQQPELGPPSIVGQGLNEGAAGTTPEEAQQVTFNSRGIRTTKFERQILLTHEVQKYSTLDQLQVMLVRVAKMWGLQLTRRAIDVLINGDATNGSLAAGTIGVEDLSNGLQWLDLIRIMARARRLGYTYTTVVTGEEETIHVLNLPEFKNLQQGRSLGEVRLQGRLPTTWDYFMHSVVGAGLYIFLDPTATLSEFVSEGLRVESEKIMQKDVSATYVRIQQGFGNLFKDARILVDSTVDFSPSNEWPVDYTPID